MKFVYKKAFLKQFDLYPAPIQNLIIEATLQIKAYLEKRTAPHGLGIKKIGPNTFEARATDKMRIVWVHLGETVYFSLLGSHDEVRRFIKNI